MKEIIKELESKVKNCHNTNTIFDTRNYVLLDDVKKLLEAINYTRCCTELKSKPILSFEDWYITYGYSKTVAGNFIKEGSRITRDELIHRYKTEHLKTF
tara:strand:- start:44 stop:340 length:297 start_codon:yes stop_codon:yes gene_type:complete